MNWWDHCGSQIGTVPRQGNFARRRERFFLWLEHFEIASSLASVQFCMLQKLYMFISWTHRFDVVHKHIAAAMMIVCIVSYYFWPAWFEERYSSICREALQWLTNIRRQSFLRIISLYLPLLCTNPTRQLYERYSEQLLSRRSCARFSIASPLSWDSQRSVRIDWWEQTSTLEEMSNTHISFILQRCSRGRWQKTEVHSSLIYGYVVPWQNKYEGQSHVPNHRLGDHEQDSNEFLSMHGRTVVAPLLKPWKV